MILKILSYLQNNKVVIFCKPVSIKIDECFKLMDFPIPLMKWYFFSKREKYFTRTVSLPGSAHSRVLSVPVASGDVCRASFFSSASLLGGTVSTFLQRWSLRYCRSCFRSMVAITVTKFLESSRHTDPISAQIKARCQLSKRKKKENKIF